MQVPIEQLKHKNYLDGYRIVYFDDDGNYSIGEFCKSIEGFMIGFAEVNPIINEEDIPTFTSIDDLLDKYLKDVNDASSVAIYKTDGTCVKKKTRE